MIVPEWKRVLEGKEPFEDPDAELLAKEIMRRMELSTNASEIIELANDLEEVMGKCEWRKRSVRRLMMKKGWPHIDVVEIDNSINYTENKRLEVLNKLKSKYGIV